MSNPRRPIIVTPTVERGPRAGEATSSAFQAQERLPAPEEVASTRTSSGRGLG